MEDVVIEDCIIVSLPKFKDVLCLKFTHRVNDISSYILGFSLIGSLMYFGLKARSNS